MELSSCLFSFAHAGPAFNKWTGLRVTLSPFLFGRPTCVYQYLCPKKVAPRVKTGNASCLLFEEAADLIFISVQSFSGFIAHPTGD